MRRLIALLALVMGLSGSPAFAAAVDQKDPLRSYYGNTYTCYWPGMWECHHWWNADGSEIFFAIIQLPEGMVTLRMIDAPHKTWTANGQWWRVNGRTAVSNANAKQGDDARNPDGANNRLDMQSLNNNKNGCQPIVDAVPGDHWFKLHLNGNETDQREQYTLMPGHQ